MSGFRLTPLTGLLLASLLINGVFLGMAIADRLDGPRRGPPEHMDRTSFVIGAFLRAAPEDKREAMEDEIRAHFREAMATRRRVWEAQKDVYAALVADPFDRPRAEAALEAAREAGLLVDVKGHEIMLDLVEDLDAETRKKALEAGFGGDFRKRMHRGGPRRHERGHDGGPTEGPPPEGPRPDGPPPDRR
ncbi:periplasmic heavy metal sensor [Euryhalocaulis caribicus]|uniref:periplasmic heavy metal sensor n=1 Tax=Euryhalocaulis caribicus TaxID=1161401 RepID=UPI0009DC4056|nr:periplasmic heavy metal sensor [Euryhalocaulis caribicus]